MEDRDDAGRGTRQYSPPEGTPQHITTAELLMTLAVMEVEARSDRGRRFVLSKALFKVNRVVVRIYEKQAQRTGPTTSRSPSASPRSRPELDGPSQIEEGSFRAPN
ncbi:hypothetical protein GWI33_012355 [Rhynchophorus ferrugineus]|uniref:Uncharacterized protein n=1 Tax=Rhynchophorus ferrugineus TaxID=354439 RepID=A0A834IRR0_RHYFE|nr:hypothetical protein GWI33_012355 [Rhynchophorus ferrugineus]